MPIKLAETIIVLCVLAFVVVCSPLVNATSPKEQYERGVELANSHHYAEAMKLLRMAADRDFRMLKKQLENCFTTVR